MAGKRKQNNCGIREASTLSFPVENYWLYFQRTTAQSDSSLALAFT